MSIRRNIAIIAPPSLGISIAILLLALTAVPAAAEQTGFNTIVQEANTLTSARIVQLILAVTVLSVAPGILVMVTCFTRFIIALSFLRSGLGLPSTPANIILISLALFMTLFTMAPVFDKAWESGLKPYMDNKLPEEEAFQRVSDPFRRFMTANVRQKDLDMFAELSHIRGGEAAVRVSRAPDADPGVHGLGIAPRFRNWLLDYAPVPRHRPHHRDAYHVDGHDDAVPSNDIHAFQDFVLHPHRWLESPGWRVGEIVPLSFGPAARYTLASGIRLIASPCVIVRRQDRYGDPETVSPICLWKG